MKRLTALALVLFTVGAWAMNTDNLNDLGTEKEASINSIQSGKENVSPAPIAVTIVPTDEAGAIEKLKIKLDAYTAFGTVWLAAITTALVAVTGYLAFFTLKLWQSTSDLVKEDEKSSALGLRAYVRVQGLEISNFLPGSHVQMRYKLVNVGRTPARNVKSFAGIHILPYPLPADTVMGPPTETQLTSQGVLFADDDYVSRTTCLAALTAQEFEDLRNGQNNRMYLFCLVSYLDIFGKSHTTEYVASIGGSALDAALKSPHSSGNTPIRFEYAAFGNVLT